MTTHARHAAARENLRQRHYAPMSESGQRIVEQGRAQRIELTPVTFSNVKTKTGEEPHGSTVN